MVTLESFYSFTKMTRNFDSVFFFVTLFFRAISQDIQLMYIFGTDAVRRCAFSMLH